MQLLALHPKVATRDCQHCLKFFYDESTGKTLPSRKPGPNGEEVPRERNENEPPPCRNPRDPEGCPKGTPENQKSLNPQNQEVWEHYQRCKAVGRFPEDAIVENNASLIRQIEDQVARLQQNEFLSQLIIGAKVKGAIR